VYTPINKPICLRQSKNKQIVRHLRLKNIAQENEQINAQNKRKSKTIKKKLS